MCSLLQSTIKTTLFQAMKWILFTGTWRLVNKQLEADVRTAVREVLARAMA